VGTGASGIDFNALRLPTDYEALAGVEPAHLTIKIRKPNRQEWFRIHPDPEWTFPTLMFMNQEDNELFLVDRPLQPALASELRPMAIYTTITRAGHIFLWPIPMPGADGHHNDWHRSALMGAERSRTQWIRLASDRSLGAYEVFTTKATLSDPVWPSLSREQIYERAFRDRIIRSLDHPVLKRLRGEL
jgi:hypothetical protein